MKVYFHIQGVFNKLDTFKALRFTATGAPHAMKRTRILPMTHKGKFLPLFTDHRKCWKRCPSTCKYLLQWIVSLKNMWDFVYHRCSSCRQVKRQPCINLLYEYLLHLYRTYERTSAWRFAEHTNEFHWLWSRRERHEVVPSVTAHGAEITCSSSVCPGNGRAEWRSWEFGSPVDCGSWVLGRCLSPVWWGSHTAEVGRRETVAVIRAPQETGRKRECCPIRRLCLQSTSMPKWARKSTPMSGCVTSATTNLHVKFQRSPRLRMRGSHP
jgi:hypothetical protein